jgi:hypothetical protein
MEYRQVKSHRIPKRLRRAILVLLLFFGVVFVVQFGSSKLNQDDADQVSSVADAPEPQASKTPPIAVVPEPSTWLMLATGLAFVSWQARRKFLKTKKMK